MQIFFLSGDRIHRGKWANMCLGLSETTANPGEISRIEKISFLSECARCRAHFLGTAARFTGNGEGGIHTLSQAGTENQRLTRSIAAFVLQACVAKLSGSASLGNQSVAWLDEGKTTKTAPHPLDRRVHNRLIVKCVRGRSSE